MLRPSSSQWPFIAVLTALVASCWAVLAFWSASPYAAYWGHDILHHVPLAMSAEYLVIMAIFVAGWVLMTIAMMLPTSLPLITMFSSLTRSRRDGTVLVALLIAGYLAVWAGFGIVAHVGDFVLHGAVRQIHWLHANTWAISSALLVGAGLFQFTELKYKCLDACRSPYSFITQHWNGRGERLSALKLGLHHGAFCVGCCWALMLLMFAFAAFHLLAMLVLGVIMAAEKNLPWGRKLAVPVGVLLLAAGAAVAVTGHGLY